jgi:ureidoacrylate peracid hydrolase
MTARSIGPGERNAWSVDQRGISLVRDVRPPDPIVVDALPVGIELDLARTSLVVVDLQNDFCHPDGWLASIGVDVTGAAGAVTALAAALPTVRRAAVPVVWVNWGTFPTRRNLPPNALHVYDPDGRGVGIGSSAPTGHPVLQRGSWGASVVDELLAVADPADTWVAKHRMSGFWDTELDSVLRNLDVDTLLFAGVNADQCVLATLVDAACAGYDVVLLEDAAATTSPDFCWDATVHNVRQCFGFTTTLAAVAGAIDECRLDVASPSADGARA